MASGTTGRNERRIEVRIERRSQLRLRGQRGGVQAEGKSEDRSQYTSWHARQTSVTVGLIQNRGTRPA